MKNNFKIGTNVKLLSFNGKSAAPKNIDLGENFWLLVGSNGAVVAEVSAKGIDGDRVLVKFENSLSALGLPSHNEIANSLWILRTDLR